MKKGLVLSAFVAVSLWLHPSTIFSQDWELEESVTTTILNKTAVLWPDSNFSIANITLLLAMMACAPKYGRRQDLVQSDDRNKR